MRLTPKQLRGLAEDGFLVIPDRFTGLEVAALERRIPSLCAEHCDANIREKDTNSVRMTMALHKRDDLFARLVVDPRLIAPVQQIFREPFYIQQTKVNQKMPMSRDVWQWHHDFGNHHYLDGVERPLALNVHVFLDDVTPFNGPICFVPGSHADKHGHLKQHPVEYDDKTTSFPVFAVTPDALHANIRRASVRNGNQGFVAATGNKGSMLIFFDTVLHCSPANFSPWKRTIFSMIVNPISNQPANTERPDHLHHRDRRPIVASTEPDLFAGFDKRAMKW
ncbi:MAG: phytanoyl-CoA dioxygenase family protein [Henriciella sp.]